MVKQLLKCISAIIDSVQSYLLSQTCDSLLHVHNKVVEVIYWQFSA